MITPLALKHSVFVEGLTLRYYFSVSPVLATDVLWGHRDIVLFLWHILPRPNPNPTICSILTLTKERELHQVLIGKDTIRILSPV